MPTIDLNADLGEECADDAAMLDVVTTANVAAGGHAGGGAVLDSTVRDAARRGVQVGAHPSYADRADFGRVSRLAQHDHSSLVALIRAQSLDVASACAEAGVPLVHVKAHGALYHYVAAEERAAEAMLVAVVEVSAEQGHPIAVVGPTTGVLMSACDRHGVQYVAEGFADRAYLGDGRLAPRSSPGAVLDDPDAVAAQAMSIAVDGMVRTVTGDVLRLHAQTLCVHGDTPGAGALATTVRRALESAGVRIASVTRP
ncbi:MAG: 5-oxoprolinase subunit PxpA [Actinomycetes bacterium]